MYPSCEDLSLFLLNKPFDIPKTGKVYVDLFEFKSYPFLCFIRLFSPFIVDICCRLCSYSIIYKIMDSSAIVSSPASASQEIVYIICHISTYMVM